MPFDSGAFCKTIYPINSAFDRFFLMAFVHETFEIFQRLRIWMAIGFGFMAKVNLMAKMETQAIIANLLK